MDRDRRWERIKLAYDLLVNGIGTHTTNAVASIEESYEVNVTDEFIHPTVMVDENNIPLAQIEEDDVVIFFNFRTDRGRELTEVLTQWIVMNKTCTNSICIMSRLPTMTKRTKI
jgi:2,3-bisphosphoglycerate-independent phosphoglycerate mutase